MCKTQTGAFNGGQSLSWYVQEVFDVEFDWCLRILVKRLLTFVYTFYLLRTIHKRVVFCVTFPQLSTLKSNPFLSVSGPTFCRCFKQNYIPNAPTKVFKNYNLSPHLSCWRSVNLSASSATSALQHDHAVPSLRSCPRARPHSQSRRMFASARLNPVCRSHLSVDRVFQRCDLLCFLFTRREQRVPGRHGADRDLYSPPFCGLAPIYALTRSCAEHRRAFVRQVIFSRADDAPVAWQHCGRSRHIIARSNCRCRLISADRR